MSKRKQNPAGAATPPGSKRKRINNLKNSIARPAALAKSHAFSAALDKHAHREGVLLVDIQHENNCLIFSAARVCTCSPDRVAKDERGKVLARLKDGDAFDPLEMVKRTRS